MQGRFGKRQVAVGGMTTFGVALPAPLGAVLCGHRLDVLRPLAKGETFDLIYESADGADARCRVRWSVDRCRPTNGFTTCSPVLRSAWPQTRGSASC
jgi:hypothetical protein